MRIAVFRRDSSGVAATTRRDVEVVTRTPSNPGFAVSRVSDDSLVVLRPTSGAPDVSRSWTHWATSRDLTSLMCRPTTPVPT